MKKSVKVYVDVHERNAGLLEAIIERGMDAEEKAMESGDVVLCYKGKTVAIEMKRTDYVQSLQSGRLRNQICKMSDHYDFYMLIVEGGKPYLSNEDDDQSFKEKMRKYKMSLRTMNRRVTTYITDSQEETCDLIEEIARDLKQNRLFVMKRPIIVSPEMSGQMKFICGLPFVKDTIGKRVLDTYGSPMEALENVDKWETIDGIGKVKIEKIKKILNGWD